MSDLNTPSVSVPVTEAVPITSVPAAQPAPAPKEDSVLAALQGQAVQPAPTEAPKADKPEVEKPKDEPDGQEPLAEDDPNLIRMRTDYSKKTAELAEKRKAVEAKEAALAEREKALAEREAQAPARGEDGRFVPKSVEADKAKAGEEPSVERLNVDDYEYESDKELARRINALAESKEGLAKDLASMRAQLAEAHQTIMVDRAAALINDTIAEIKAEHGVTLTPKECGALLVKHQGMLDDPEFGGDWSPKLGVTAYAREHALELLEKKGSLGGGSAHPVATPPSHASSGTPPTQTNGKMTREERILAAMQTGNVRTE